LCSAYSVVSTKIFNNITENFVVEWVRCILVWLRDVSTCSQMLCRYCEPYTPVCITLIISWKSGAFFVVLFSRLWVHNTVWI